MDIVKSLPFKDYMHFPQFTADLEMTGGNKEGIIKEKLKNVLAAKLSGMDDLPLTDIFESGSHAPEFDADPAWLFSEDYEGWQYYHLMGMSGNYTEYEEQLWHSDGYPCRASMWLALLATSYYSDFVSGTDSPPPREVMVDVISENLSGFEENDGLSPELEDAADDLYRALLSIREGNGLENHEVINFISGISSCYGDAFSPGTIIDNMELFTDCLSIGVADRAIRTVAISSSEVFQYRKYRQRVPVPLRRDFDNALGIFENPLPDCPVVWEDNEDKGVSAVAFALMEESGFGDIEGSSLNMHPLYTEALKFLINNLPVLRKEYGDAVQHPLSFFSAITASYSTFRFSLHLSLINSIIIV